MNTLGELGVALPTSDDNLKNTIEELKAKLCYYKENQERVTQEVLSFYVAKLSVEHRQS